MIGSRVAPARQCRISRVFSLGQVECVEEPVQYGELRGVVLVVSVPLVRVMPMMIFGRSDYPLQKAEFDTHIRMKQVRVPG